jgi:hypothetical protein
VSNHLAVSIRRGALASVVALSALFAGFAAPASAHGPVAPAASSFVAKVGEPPPGLEAKVIDGDQRMWLRAPASATVIVLDYRGAPYLRFSAAGVEVNRNSAMYYLNQTPVAAVPPTNLSPRTPASWHRVSAGHAYSWHDGRLHALAAVAISPGTSYVGRWTIPLRIGGAPAALSGTVWHAPNASIVWFWPIVVLLACVLAAWRVGDRRLDDRLVRVLAVTALVSIAVAAGGHELHGRPNVSAWQVAELVAILAFVLWGLRRILSARAGYFTYFAVAFVALWQGLTLVSVLVEGFVLIALPPFIARAATVLSLACGAAILILVYRLATATRGTSEDEALPDELELGGFGAAISPPRSAPPAPEPRAGR